MGTGRITKRPGGCRVSPLLPSQKRQRTSVLLSTMKRRVPSDRTLPRVSVTSMRRSGSLFEICVMLRTARVLEGAVRAREAIVGVAHAAHGADLSDPVDQDAHLCDGVEVQR